MPERFDLRFPFHDLAFTLLYGSDERYRLGSRGSLECLHLEVLARFGDFGVHLIHALAKSVRKLGKNLLLPLIVFRIDLNLHLFVVDRDITKAFADVRVIKGRTGFANLLQKL